MKPSCLTHHVHTPWQFLFIYFTAPHEVTWQLIVFHNIIHSQEHYLQLIRYIGVWGSDDAAELLRMLFGALQELFLDIFKCCLLWECLWCKLHPLLQFSKPACLPQYMQNMTRSFSFNQGLLSIKTVWNLLSLFSHCLFHNLPFGVLFFCSGSLLCFEMLFFSLRKSHSPSRLIV